MNPLEQLKSVICDPDGKCCITGSDEDRAIVDRALQALAPTSTQCEVQPEQEPVAWEQFYPDIGKPQLGQEPFGYVWLNTANFRKKIPPTGESEAWNAVYTTPPQRPWVGLTDEERNYCVETPFVSQQWANIEAKLKELNT